MTEKYELKIQKSDGDSFTTTEYETTNPDDLARYMKLAGITTTNEDLPGYMQDYGTNYTDSVEYDLDDFEEITDVTESEEDRDDFEYDYGQKHQRRKTDALGSGYAIDGFDYKGREEAEGTELRVVNNYGNNPMKARTPDVDLEEDCCDCCAEEEPQEEEEGCQCPQCRPDLHGAHCSCYHCLQTYGTDQDSKYDYETDELGNVLIHDRDNDCSVLLQGSDALEVLQSLDNAGGDPRAIQIVLRQYDYMMEKAEDVLSEKIDMEYRKFVNEVSDHEKYKKLAQTSRASAKRKLPFGDNL